MHAIDWLHQKSLLMNSLVVVAFFFFIRWLSICPMSIINACDPPESYRMHVYTHVQLIGNFMSTPSSQLATCVCVGITMCWRSTFDSLRMRSKSTNFGVDEQWPEYHFFCTRTPYSPITYHYYESAHFSFFWIAYRTFHMCALRMCTCSAIKIISISNHFITASATAKTFNAHSHSRSTHSIHFIHI